MDNITQLTDTVYAVKVPEGSDYYAIRSSKIFYSLRDKNSFFEPKDCPPIDLPPGQWRLIGNAKEVSDEVAATIVERAKMGEYLDYVARKTSLGKHGSYFFSTAKESLSSLLKSKECTDGEIILIEKIK